MHFGNSFGLQDESSKFRRVDDAARVRNEESVCKVHSLVRLVRPYSAQVPHIVPIVRTDFLTPAIPAASAREKTSYRTWLKIGTNTARANTLVNVDL